MSRIVTPLPDVLSGHCARAVLDAFEPGADLPSRRRDFPYLGMSDVTERMMDITEVAERLGVGERFVRRLVEERRIPYFKVGRHVRFTRDDVDRWIAESRVEPLRAFPATAARAT